MKQQQKDPLVGVTIAMAALAVIGVAFTVSWETRSKAGSSQHSRTGLPGPRAPLAAPYVRLAVGEADYRIGARIPVTILANTNNIETLETHVVLTYDPEVLEVVAADIALGPQYRVLNVERAEQGKIAFSLFVSVDGGQAPVRLAAEAPVATVTFTARQPTAGTRLGLAFDPADPSASGMYAMRAREDGEPSPNILRTVGGLSVSVR